MSLPSPTAIWTESPTSGAARVMSRLSYRLVASLSTLDRPVYELSAQSVGDAGLVPVTGLSVLGRPVYQLQPGALVGTARLARLGTASPLRPLLLLY
jgi:hypothetical protein